MIESPLTREGPTNSMPLTITYSPVGIGRIRLWIVFGSSMEQMKKLGLCTVHVYVCMYVCISYYTPDRCLPRIHEVIFNNPEGRARGLIEYY